MKSFFTGMSFPRAVILFCTLGSIALGTLVYLRTEELKQVEADLKRVPELVQQIHEDAYRLSDLQRNAGNEKFKAQSEPESYIRAIAGDKNVNMGQIDIAKNQKSFTRATTDNIYKITPQTRTQRFNLAQIGNFLYKLEADSRRVKVTRVKVTPFEKVSPGEIGSGDWVYEIELTTRSKNESSQG